LAVTWHEKAALYALAGPWQEADLLKLAKIIHGKIETSR
jgi:hypothetical protein